MKSIIRGNPWFCLVLFASVWPFSGCKESLIPKAVRTEQVKLPQLEEVESDLAGIFVSNSGNNANKGTSWDLAVATLEQAITQAKAEQLNTIYLAAGETFTTSLKLNDMTDLTFVGGYKKGQAKAKKSFDGKAMLQPVDKLSSIVEITDKTRNIAFKGLVFTGATVPAVSTIGKNSAYIDGIQFFDCEFTKNMGGAIFADWVKNLTLNGVIAENNEKKFGAFLYVNNSAKISLIDVKVENNTATNSGTIFLAQSTEVSFYNLLINKNKATEYGGGLSLVQINNAVIENMVLTNNEAKQGAAIYMLDCDNLLVRNTRVAENRASNDGVIRVRDGNNLEFDFSGQHITGNKARNGGVLFASGVKEGLKIRGGIFDGNEAYNNGAVFALDNVTDFAANGSQFNNNFGKDSGTIYINNPQNSLVFNDIEMSGNKATDGFGGAIKIENGKGVTSIRLTNSSFINNYAGVNGGALFGNGFVFGKAGNNFLITNTLFQGNDSGEYGGALALDLTSLDRGRQPPPIQKNKNKFKANPESLDYAKVVIGKGTQFVKNHSAQDGGGGSIAVQFDPSVKPNFPQLIFSKAFPEDVRENTAGNGEDGNEIRITKDGLSIQNLPSLRLLGVKPTFDEWSDFIYVGDSGISPVPKSVYAN